MRGGETRHSIMYPAVGGADVAGRRALHWRQLQQECRGMALGRWAPGQRAPSQRWPTGFTEGGDSRLRTEGQPGPRPRAPQERPTAERCSVARRRALPWRQLQGATALPQVPSLARRRQREGTREGGRGR